MSILSLTLKRYQAQFGSCSILVLLITLAATLLFGLTTLSQNLQNRLFKEVGQVDAVIGAKGSPLQLILSTIHHIDIPTGNIKYEDYKAFQKDRSLKAVIPLSLGDQFKSYRIVGTEPSYFQFYNLSLQAGTFFTTSMQAVIGAEVAEKSGLKIGDTFTGSHGLSHIGHEHEDAPYTVVGILQKSGTTSDRLVLTSLQSVWDVHSHNHANNAAAMKQAAEFRLSPPKDAEVTALLIQYKTRLAAMNFPRKINRLTAYQAASPATEMARLTSLLGFGKKALLLLTGFILFAAFASLCLNLTQSVHQRRYELAIYRSLGASKAKVSGLILLDAFLLTFAGLFMAVLLTQYGFTYLGQIDNQLGQLNTSLTIFTPTLLLLSGFIFAASLLSALIPAYQAYKVDIWSVLHE